MYWMLLYKLHYDFREKVVDILILMIYIFTYLTIEKWKIRGGGKYESKHL